jgi:ArsR family transcriptional regulator
MYKRNTVSALSEFQAASVAKILGDRTRLGILAEIARHEELSVGELGACRKVSRPSVSHHLRILTQAGLVTFRRDGRYIFYRAIHTRLLEYSQFLSRLGNSDV